MVGPKVENGDYLMLGVARSIGDRPFKATTPPLVPATPDVTRHDAGLLGAQLVIVASDGVWDVVTNRKACEVVGAALRGGATPIEAAAALCNAAILARSDDNVSAAVIAF